MLGGIKEKASPAHVSPLKANFSTGFPTKTVDSLKKYPRKPNDNDINTTNSSEEDSSNALAEIESLISPKNIAFLRSEKFQKILQESRISEEDPGARQTVPNRKATADTLNDRGSVRSSGASGNSSNYSNGGCRGSVTSNSYNDGNSGEGGSILADTDNNNNNNNNNSRINHNHSSTTNYDNSYSDANSEAASTSKDRDATVSKVDIDSSNSESYSNRKKSSNNQNIVILNKESNTINSNSLAQIFDIDGRRVLGKNACCSLIDATLLKWENGDFGGLVSNPLWKESFARAVYENICSGELVTITDETSESYENDIGFSIDYFLQVCIWELIYGDFRVDLTNVLTINLWFSFYH